MIFGRVLISSTISSFDISIPSFASLYLGLALFTSWRDGFSASSAMLHPSGAAIGFVIAVVILKRDWVDCENWDLFAVLGGRERQKSAPKRRRNESSPKPAMLMPGSPNYSRRTSLTASWR